MFYPGIVQNVCVHVTFQRVSKVQTSVMSHNREDQSVLPPIGPNTTLHTIHALPSQYLRAGSVRTTLIGRLQVSISSGCKQGNLRRFEVGNKQLVGNKLFKGGCSGAEI